MPSKNQKARERTLQQVVEEIGLYPAEAFEFIQQGLGVTVQKIHAEIKDPAASRHVSGQQLCCGLRDYALSRWGYMARTVLRQWNVTTTLDFGRIVFALIEAGQMQKTDQDTLEDFKAVYDFRSAFESGYQIPTEPVVAKAS